MGVGDVIEKIYQRRQDADEGATRGARRAGLTIIIEYCASLSIVSQHQAAKNCRSSNSSIHPS